MTAAPNTLLVYKSSLNIKVTTTWEWMMDSEDDVGSLRAVLRVIYVLVVDGTFSH
jgi:hypothetical protein